MNWRKYKLLPKAEKADESKFILGIDIGNDSSAIAFYDALRGGAEIIDVSGGYGRPAVPTVAQYIRETKEWVFGEYAVLNRGQGQEVTLGSLTEKLGRREYLDIDGKPVSNTHILGLFLKEIIGGVKNINPKAEIVGIVASAPGYLSEEAGEELTRAFRDAGYEKELICLAPERECVFAGHFKREAPENRTVLLLDYGSRQMRGGLYRVEIKERAAKDKSQTKPETAEIEIKSLSSLFSDELGTERVDEALSEMLLADFPRELTPRLADQFPAFLYQHKDLLFQKSGRPAKLYMNFVYPPVQVTVPKARVEKLIAPFRELFTEFIKNTLEKNIYGNGPTGAGDVSWVLCSGGGFEMPWTKDVLAGMFPEAKIFAPRNSKAAAAEGAALLAAAKLGVEDGVPGVFIEDLHQIPVDVGLNVRADGREKFMPLVERNSFWWQKQAKRMFIINEPIGGANAGRQYLELLSRAAGGDVTRLARVSLEGFPERPKGAARLGLSVEFESGREMRFTVEDGGFGEMYPKSGFEKTVKVRI